jgi:colanic acid/amylovoran biosynthesis glycosyltransferase
MPDLLKEREISSRMMGHRSEERRDRRRPLRIAMFVNEFPALSETFVLNQITGLLDLGHDVTILATQARAEKGAHADVMRYGLGERLQYRNMPGSRVTRLEQLPGIVAHDPTVLM